MNFPEPAPRKASTTKYWILVNKDTYHAITGSTAWIATTIAMLYQHYENQVCGKITEKHLADWAGGELLFEKFLLMESGTYPKNSVVSYLTTESSVLKTLSPKL